MKKTKLLAAIVAATFLGMAGVKAQTWSEPTNAATWSATDFIGTTSGSIAGDLVFKTQGTERLRVLGSTTVTGCSPGNVGIGTSAPTAPLHVSSNNTANTTLLL